MFSMPSALCLLSCLLTLAASGDDFCLPRVVFDVPAGADTRLPLDDPNTDFVVPATPITAHLHDSDRPVAPAESRPDDVTPSAVSRPAVAARSAAVVPPAPPTGAGAFLRC
ncbi:MAG TPA: hypothetical protein VFW33_06610 [Gemmataceae bacterium]|nr:hypothetical protein [Gemmataceae bacterium]